MRDNLHASFFIIYYNLEIKLRRLYKMVIEKRKVDYLLDNLEHKMTLSELNSRFDEIDRRVEMVKSGQLKTVYEPSEYCDYFPKKIVSIVDEKRGLIKTYEESIGKYEVKNIMDYLLEMN